MIAILRVDHTVPRAVDEFAENRCDYLVARMLHPKADQTLYKEEASEETHENERSGDNNLTITTHSVPFMLNRVE